MAVTQQGRDRQDEFREWMDTRLIRPQEHDVKGLMKVDRNRVGDKYTTSISWQYPSVFDLWDIKKLINSKIGDTCPSCGKRCASAAGLTMHWERKPRKCQARRQCPDITLLRKAGKV